VVVVGLVIVGLKTALTCIFKSYCRKQTHGEYGGEEREVVRFGT
jgi:hypothetical protein